MVGKSSSRVELARRRIRSFDTDYHKSLYIQACYALGVKEPVLDSAIQGEFPYFEDVWPTELNVGESRRILGTMFAGMSRVSRIEPTPRFRGVDRVTSLVRASWYEAKHRLHDWGDVYSAAFVDAESTGVGAIMLTSDTDADGYQYIDLMHVPSYNVIWDRSVRSPHDASWVCIVTSMDVDEAVLVYGEGVRKHAISISRGKQGFDDTMVVRVFDYWERSIDDRKIRNITFPGSFTQGEPIEREMAFKSLPIAFMTYFTPPGARRPIGKVSMQMPTQEALNVMEDYFRRQALQSDFTVYDTNAIDPDDVQSIARGEIPQYVRLNAKPEIPGGAARVTGGGVNPAAIQVWNLLERQFNADSMMSDLDRQNFSHSARTLGENQMMVQRSDMYGGWSMHMALIGYERVMRKLFEIAPYVDNCMITIDADGTDYTINDSTEESSLETWFKDRAHVYVDKRSISFADEQEKRNDTLQLLAILTPYAQGGHISNTWLAKRVLDVIGEDSSEAIPQASGGAAETLAGNAVALDDESFGSVGAAIMDSMGAGQSAVEEP